MKASINVNIKGIGPLVSQCRRHRQSYRVVVWFPTHRNKVLNNFVLKLVFDFATYLFVLTFNSCFVKRCINRHRDIYFI